MDKETKSAILGHGSSHRCGVATTEQDQRHLFIRTAADNIFHLVPKRNRRPIDAQNTIARLNPCLSGHTPRYHRIDGQCPRSQANKLVAVVVGRSEEHTSELQSLMRISYAVFCLKTNNKNT